MLRPLNRKEEELLAKLSKQKADWDAQVNQGLTEVAKLVLEEAGIAYQADKLALVFRKYAVALNKTTANAIPLEEWMYAGSSTEGVSDA